MQDLNSMLAQLRRPRLLTRAAGIAAEDYCREKHLTGLLGQASLPRPASAALQLLQREAELDQLRRDKDATYSATRHVTVLSALIGEARLMQAAARDSQPAGL